MMKTNILKPDLLMCALAPFCLIVSSCAGSGNNEDADAGRGGTEVSCRQVLKEYFSAKIEGDGAEFPAGAVLSGETVEDDIAAVWDIWKEANEDFSEVKLADISPLSSGRSGRWILPSDMEPDAYMQYYFGTKGDRPEDGWPLYLYLHGSGDRIQEWATGLELCRGFDDAPSLYFIPQIPNAGEWYRWWQKSKQWAWEKLLRLVLASGDADPDKVFFFGISEGGYGSQRLASFYADYLAGAGPMAGGEPLKNAPAENCANIAFSLRTGAEDAGFGRNTLTGYVKDEFDRLEQKHPGYYKHWIELIPDYGHSIDYSGTTPWLAGYERNPWPKYFCWENFEMDGRYRDGFYNLQVLERSNQDASSRTVYEMEIEGNNVSLDIRNVHYETVETANGIEMKFEKSYDDVSSGRIRVYLDSHLVDLSAPVTIKVNGKVVFEDMLEPDLKMMAESCALFGDPRRVYPCGVDVQIGS